MAVAASLCAAAVGTETCGSILSPSWRNGIVGLKPTVGLISRGGIVPLASSQDTAGPMGRTVEDVTVLLGGYRLMKYEFKANLNHYLAKTVETAPSGHLESLSNIMKITRNFV